MTIDQIKESNAIDNITFESIEIKYSSSFDASLCEACTLRGNAYYFVVYHVMSASENPYLIPYKTYILGDKIFEVTFPMN